MDYSRCARLLAVELSNSEVSEGLTEANRSRRKDSAITTSWIGLPAPLQQKMVNRIAAGLGVRDEWDIRYLCAVVVTICGALLAIMTSVVTAIGIHVGGSSWRIGLLWAMSLAVLAAGARALRADRKGVNPELALTPMEQVVVRGYLAAPPNLLQPTDPGIATRLAALAGLASREIRQNRVWADDRSLVDTTGLDLDRTVVYIYELAREINEARGQLSSTEAHSAAYESRCASAELAGAVESAESGLEMLVAELCAYAHSFLQVEQLFRDEERLTSLMDPTADVMINGLLASSVRAECAARDLNVRGHELDELKGVLEARRPILISSWPGDAFGA
jgi:hypothetical protein